MPVINIGEYKVIYNTLHDIGAVGFNKRGQAHFCKSIMKEIMAKMRQTLSKSLIG